MNQNTLSPILSVAIIPYNRGSYLRDCIDSVSRHLPGVKCTVHDDSSTSPPTKKTVNSVKIPLNATPSELASMPQRSLEAHPFSEDFISNAGPKVHRPNRFNVHRTGWLPRLLNLLEKLMTVG